MKSIKKNHHYFHRYNSLVHTLFSLRISLSCWQVIPFQMYLICLSMKSSTLVLYIPKRICRRMLIRVILLFYKEISCCKAELSVIKRQILQRKSQVPIFFLHRRVAIAVAYHCTENVKRSNSTENFEREDGQWAALFTVGRNHSRICARRGWDCYGRRLLKKRKIGMMMGHRPEQDKGKMYLCICHKIFFPLSYSCRGPIASTRHPQESLPCTTSAASAQPLLAQPLKLRLPGQQGIFTNSGYC